MAMPAKVGTSTASFRPLSGMRYLNLGCSLDDIIGKPVKFPSPLGDEVLKPLVENVSYKDQYNPVSVPSRG